MSGIVVLADVVFPNSVLVDGLSGSLNRENTRTRNQAGFGSVNVVRDVTLRAWQVATQPMRLRDAEKLIAVLEVSDFGAYGILLEDPIDSLATQAQGALQGSMAGVEFGAVGRGNGTPNYGFRKLYTPAGSTRTRARLLTRMKGAPALQRNGVAVATGAAPGNVAISACPSYVTFMPDAARTVVALVVGATTQITLSSAIVGLAVGGRLWLQGVPGGNAGLVNGLSHEITAIAGATYTLAVNTVGKAITAGGQGHMYPQPNDTLTWSGRFYVPVQFRDDELNWQLDAGGPDPARLVSLPSTYLDEIRET